MLRLCLRTTEALAASANALRDHGPFQLYPNPNPNPDPDPDPNQDAKQLPAGVYTCDAKDDAMPMAQATKPEAPLRLPNPLAPRVVAPPGAAAAAAAAAAL